MKRFYKQASIRPEGAGFLVVLDSKPIRTPGGHPLALPVADLAEAIAGEWQQQPEQGEIRPQEMRLMRLAATGLDRVPIQRNKVIDDTARYAGSDLLCYRASEPDDLVVRQYKAWQPILDWAASRYGLQLSVQTGLQHVAQPPDVLAGYRAEVQRFSNLGLSALYNLTSTMGSLILALALNEARLDAAAAFAAAEIDSLYQVERWGEDSEARRRREAIRDDIAAMGRFLDLLGGARYLA